MEREAFETWWVRSLGFARSRVALARLGPEESEDLLAESYRRAAERCAQIPADPRGRTTWLRWLVFNAVRDRLRQLNRERRVVDAFGRSIQTAGESAPESGLGPAQRRCVVLIARGYAVKQAAKKLGVQPSTVRRRLRDAAKSLGVPADHLLVVKAAFRVHLVSLADLLYDHDAQIDSLDRARAMRGKRLREAAGRKGAKRPDVPLSG